jgi:hypothetical protein
MWARHSDRTVDAPSARAATERSATKESVMTQPQATRSPRPVEPATATVADERLRDDESDHAVGWIVFAAIVLAVLGVLNGIYGIAAIASSDAYSKDAVYVLGNLETYGWLMLLIGVVQFCASLGVLAFARWARWVGAASAAANAMVQLLVMPAAPLLALALLAVDVLVVYALVAYGGRWQAT